MAAKTVKMVVASCLVAMIAGSGAMAKTKKKDPSPVAKPKVQTTVPAEKPRSSPPTGRPRKMEQRLREAFGATEEQWKSFGSQVMKVNALLQQLDDHGMSGMRGERETAPVTPASQQTSLQKATAALHKSLADPATSPEAIKTQVASVRREKESVQNDLHAARAELQKLLNERQQAQALLLGLLE